MPIKRRNRVRAFHAVIAACALSAIATTAHSADSSDPPRNTGLPCGYEVAAIIQGPPQPALVTRVTGLNEDGWVSGYWSGIGAGSDRAYYWKPEFGESVFTIPLHAGYTRSFATDINDNGLVVGYMSGPGNPSRGFAYDTNTDAMVAILEPIDPDGFDARCWANAINNDGVVVGARSLGETQQPYNAFIWTPNKDDPTHGTYTDLGVMNGPSSWATAISNTGWIGGTTGTPFGPNRRGFAFDGDDLLITDALPTCTISVVNAVNDSGELAGGGLTDPEQVPEHFSIPGRWVDGEWHLLSIYPFCWASAVFSIDAHGTVVGRCTTPQQVESFPLMWIGEAMFDLNDFVEPQPGIEIREARIINNVGQILTRGRYNGKNVGFILNPIHDAIGDLTGDCEIGPEDLAQLLREWGKQQSPADLNGDGIVDGADLAILLGNWTP